MKTVKKSLLTAVAAVVIAIQPAYAGFDLFEERASHFSYNYLEGGYRLDDESASYNSDLDGFFVEGAFDVTRNIAVTLRYITQDGSSSQWHIASVDYSQMAGGITYHLQYGELFKSGLADKSIDYEKMDLYARIMLVRSELERVGETYNGRRHYWHDSSDSDIGPEVAVGARYEFRPNIEFGAELGLITLADVNVFLGASARYMLNRNISFEAAFELANDSAWFLGGGRSLSFAARFSL